jgi:hypothetical protein
MAIDGKIGSTSYTEERARANGHDPVILAGAVKAAQGELPVGLVLTRDANGDFIPYEEVANEVIGTGTGTATAFSGTLTKKPVEPGSVSVTDGVEAFSDDGFGTLTGAAGGTGTVNYGTGAISVTFNAAPANTVEVKADYVTAIDGILDEKVDTAKTASATYIPHGSVRRDALKVGAATPADPDATLLKRLTAKGIYPMG